MYYDIDKLKTATAEELTEFYLYRQIIDIMTATDGQAPAGSCCGGNKKQHAEEFIANKDKYLHKLEIMTQENKIKALVHGAQYIGAIKKHVNIDTLSDEEIIDYIKNGYLPAAWFDLSAYNAPKQETATAATTETKTAVKGTKKAKK